MNDYVYGNKGDDRIYVCAQGGANFVHGGSGHDMVKLQQAYEAYTIDSKKKKEDTQKDSCDFHLFPA